MKIYNSREGKRKFYTSLYPQDSDFFYSDINKIQKLAIEPCCISVIWSRSCYKKWDQGFFQDIIGGKFTYTETHVLNILDDENDYNIVIDGAIVVHPMIMSKEEEEKFTEYLKKFKSVIFVSTSDEEFKSLDLRALEIATISWRQCYKAETYPEKTKFFTLGYSRGFPDCVRKIYKSWGKREYLSGFAGQMQNRDRESMFKVMAGTPRWKEYKTQSFGSGLTQTKYAEFMCDVRIAPCPQGNVMVETFRCAEALEAGCVPIATKSTSLHGVPNYWEAMFGFPAKVDGVYPPPFPLVDNFDDPRVLEIVDYYYKNPTELLEMANKCQEWWNMYKIMLTRSFMEDVRKVKNIAYGSDVIEDMILQRLNPEFNHFLRKPSNEITAIIITNNTPINPKIERIYQVLKSLRSYSDMRECQAIIAFDGLYHEGRKKYYEQYKRNIIEQIMNAIPREKRTMSLERMDYLEKGVLSTIKNFVLEKDSIFRNEEFVNTHCIFMPKHLHQANTLKEALKFVNTKYVLILEHDCLLNEDIKFREILDLMDAHDDVKHVGLSLRSSTILDDGEPISYASNVYDSSAILEEGGIRLLKTINWSMRPHIAKTEYYKNFLMSFIEDDSKTYLEDVIYAIEMNRCLANVDAWKDFGTWYFYPREGRMCCHIHHDCRGLDPKVPLELRYKDGVTPDGAPAPVHDIAYTKTLQEFKEDHGFQIPREKNFVESIYAIVEDMITEMFPKHQIQILEKEPKTETVITFRNQLREILDNLCEQEEKGLTQS